ncbi:MAG TPA: biotin/lipoyl-binding protein, partial [Microbacterium sp.]|nr:biotin/lipoyl-binding protein [Microbacterium sp.]
MNARTFLPRSSRRMIVIIAAVLVVLSAAAVWVFVFLLPSQSSAAQTVTQTTPASLVTMQKSVTTTGTVTPAVQEDVSFAVSGTVTSIAVAEGDTVAADAPLATVDTLELQADLYDAQATL